MHGPGPGRANIQVMIDSPELLLDYDAGTKPAGKAELYGQLRERINLLLEGETDWLANLGNAAAEIFAWLPHLNWAGWYLLRGEQLVLGPFQGRPACVRIPLGRGVCGTAAASGESQVVPDVNAFPGHITCDVRSRSEIVIPVKVAGKVVAVLDLDSSQYGTFTEEDREGLEALAADLVLLIDWERALNS